MITIAVVGKIGSGKSTIREVIKQQSGLKVGTIDLDVICKQMREYAPTLMEQLHAAFGPRITDSNYVIETIFADDDLYQTLVDIYGGYLCNYLCALKAVCDVDSYDVLLVEGASIIHNKDLFQFFDGIINVTTPISICADRVRGRNKYTEHQIQLLLSRTEIMGSIMSGMLTDKNSFSVDRSYDKHEIVGLVEWINSLSNPIKVSGRIAIYQGSFNPLHVGHMAVIQEALRSFDNVVLLKCINGTKERSEDFPIDAQQLPVNCHLRNWDKSFVQFLDENYHGEDVTIIRGIRNATDLQYEQDYIAHLKQVFLSKYGKVLPPVMFIPVDREFHHISSTSIRAMLPFEPEYAKSLMVAYPF